MSFSRRRFLRGVGAFGAVALALPRLEAHAACGVFLERLEHMLGLPAQSPLLGDVAFAAGQHKRAKFPSSKAPISASFHSFRLIFGRAIISRNCLEAWMLFP